MKRLPLKKVPQLAPHVESLDEEPVILTANGRAVAAVVAVPNADAETISLSTNPEFLAIIERSRRRHQREGGISPAQMRRRLGLEGLRRRATARRPKTKS